MTSRSRFNANQDGSISLPHHANFRRRGPRLAIDFRKRLELDEAASLRLDEGDGFQFLAGFKRTLRHRLPEIHAVIADIKFVILDLDRKSTRLNSSHRY